VKCLYVERTSRGSSHSPAICITDCVQPARERLFLGTASERASAVALILHDFYSELTSKETAQLPWQMMLLSVVQRIVFILFLVSGFAAQFVHGSVRIVCIAIFIASLVVGFLLFLIEVSQTEERRSREIRERDEFRRRGGH